MERVGLLASFFQAELSEAVGLLMDLQLFPYTD